jgi:hypothetical protein
MNISAKLASVLDYNKLHEECGPDESFCVNVYTGTGDDFIDVYFRMVGFTKKRLGKCAYDLDGNILTDYAPVFVNKLEFRFRKVLYSLLFYFMVCILTSVV